MKTLFVIAVISCAALIWAALAIVRHVRKNSARAARLEADAELQQAIDLRLSDLGRQPSRQPFAEDATGIRQNFSYFNRDGASPTLEKRP
jgi:hypothetical protein